MICNFFLRGQCKFGENCRNEHPRQPPAFGNSTWINPNRNPDSKITFPFSADSMGKDLTANVDKPIWPLSSYGPAKFEPILLGGLDESPEELRLRAATSLRAGNANEYMTYEASKISAAEAVYNNARANIQQAFEAATKQSPLAPLLASTSQSALNKPSAFGTATSSSFGGAKSAFGQSEFTTATSQQPSTSTATGPFGQPLQQPSTSTATGPFGQPLQQPSTSTATGPFGRPLQQPSTSTATGPFGQPLQQPSTSTATGPFGQPLQQPTSAFGAQTFGQTSQPQSTIIRPGTGAFSNFATGSGTFGASGNAASSASGFSAFAGQPSAFGLGASAPSSSTVTTGSATFGQPSLGGTPSAFSTLTQQPPQAQSAFGTFGQPTIQPNSSAFGTPTTTTTTTTTTTAPSFGSRTQLAQPFTSTPAQPPQQPLPGFSAFSNPTSVFGQPSPQQPPPGFSAFAAQPPNASRTNPFASSSTGSAKNPQAGAPNFDAIIEVGLQYLSGAAPGGSRQTTLFKPNSTPYDGNIPPNYSDLVPREALEAFKSKKFEWGAVPEWVPPFELR